MHTHTHAHTHTHTHTCTHTHTHAHTHARARTHAHTHAHAHTHTYRGCLLDVQPAGDAVTLHVVFDVPGVAPAQGFRGAVGSLGLGVARVGPRVGQEAHRGLVQLWTVNSQHMEISKGRVPAVDSQQSANGNQ